MKAQRRQPHRSASLEPQVLMRLALRLAARSMGRTSPNPMVGAVLVKNGEIIGQGWHHQAGLVHAEVEAINDARRQGRDPSGSTLFVTLEPCSTNGRTPPCTEAIISAGIRQVVAAAADQFRLEDHCLRSPMPTGLLQAPNEASVGSRV